MKKSIKVFAAIIITSVIYTSCGNSLNETSKNIRETKMNYGLNSIEDSIQQKKIKDFQILDWYDLKLTRMELKDYKVIGDFSDKDSFDSIDTTH